MVVQTLRGSWKKNFDFLIQLPSRLLIRMKMNVMCTHTQDKGNILLQMCVERLLYIFTVNVNASVFLIYPLAYLH